ncbi:MAG: cytochrome c family protein, partial [Caldimicrobium sp.]|nr:cytochrome c family protein [Caldimicrobium sp.]
MKGIRYLLWFLPFVLFFLLGKAYGEKLVDTLDELEKIYPPSSVCAGCHANIFEQWKVSLHQESILHSIGGLANFIKFGINGEPERKARAEKPGGLKAEMMKCFTCHAPQLELASDKLIK